MVYGDEKLLEMARSILPSYKGDVARKDKASCKRRARRRMKQELHRPLEEDNEIEDHIDLKFYPNHEIRGIVRERRDADKLHHFQTWAVAYTKDLPDPSSRMARMKKILPGNLIGWHARSHLEGLTEFNDNHHLYRRLYRYRYSQNPAFTDETYTWILNKVLEDSELISLLNNHMRHTHGQKRWVIGYGEPRILHKKVWGVEGEVPYLEFLEITEDKGPGPRLLKGPLDVESFLSDIKKAAKVKQTVSTPIWVHKKIQTVLTCGIKGIISHWSIIEDRRNTRPNPEYHYEWGEALKSFTKSFLEHRGVAWKMKKAGFDFSRKSTF